MRGERSWGMGCASAGRVKGAWRHWGSQLERCKTRIAKSGAGAGFAREVLTWVRGRRPRTPGPRHVHVALGRDVYEASPLPPPLPPPAPGLSWAPGCCRWPSGGRPAFPRDRRGSVRAGLRGAPRGGMRVRLSWASPGEEAASSPGEEAASPGGGVRGPDRSRLPRPVAKTSGPSRQTPVAGPYFATPSQRAASGSRSPPPALERSAAERSGAAQPPWRGVAWHGTAVSVSAPRAGPPRCPPAPLPLPPGPPRPLPRAPL